MHEPAIIEPAIEPLTSSASSSGRIVLRRATAVADFNDAVHGGQAVGLHATHDGVVVLLHEIAFGDIVGAAFGAEDQEAGEARPVDCGIFDCVSTSRT